MSDLDNVFGVDPVDDGQVDDAQDTQDINDTSDNDQATPDDDGQVDDGQTSDATDNSDNDDANKQPLILGKFKSQDDLTNAYQNLEREFTRLRQQMPKPQATPPKEQSNEEEQLIAWYNQTVQTDPINANATLARYMAQKEIDARMAQVNPIIEERQTNKWIQDTASRYKDFYDYTEQMATIIPEIVADDPSLEGSPLLYKTAYLEAKSRSLEEKAKTAFENGKKAAFDGKTAKQKLTNELSKPKPNDILPDGITLISQGDGIFL